ncbi:MAG: DJ-1/PfpI family protein [Pseudomonadota bacterium]
MDNARRKLLVSALGAALAGTAKASNGSGDGSDEAQHSHDMSAFPEHWTRPDKVAMLAYPGFTALDLVGPQYMFAGLMGATVQVVAKTMDPIRSDTGLVVIPDAVFADVPRNLTVLFVPGSAGGALEVLEDTETMAFVADRGTRADWVTSVCTGSVLLAAAGLLDGYRATSHWVTEPAIAELGAILDPARVVRDRNRITGAGVTAGVDFGLTMIEILRDRTYAMAMQLLAQYDPAPPFNAGSPNTAPPEVTAMLTGMFPGFSDRAAELGKAARRKLPKY